MEDLFGFLLFIGFLGFALVGKLLKRPRTGEDTGREPRREQWPGPVARPGIPGYPRPATPPVPRQQVRPPQRPTPRFDADDDDEGVSIEGVSIEGVSIEGVSTEGPAAGENVRAELARFNEVSSRFGRFDRLKTALHAPDSEAAVAGEGPDALVGLDDPQSVARAFVLAEVLGKPRALRGRTR